MPLPFSKQQKNSWCGPAVAQMVLRAHGRIWSQRSLAKKFKTNARLGTSRHALVALLKQQGIVVYVYRQATIAQLRKQTPAIVNYQEVDGDDHYAIATRTTKTHVILHDPWHGPNYKISIRAFLNRWKNPKHRRKYTGWAVSFA